MANVLLPLIRSAARRALWAVVGQLSKSESCMIVPGPASNVRVTLKNTRGQSVGAYSDA